MAPCACGERLAGFVVISGMGSAYAATLAATASWKFSPETNRPVLHTDVGPEGVEVPVVMLNAGVP